MPDEPSKGVVPDVITYNTAISACDNGQALTPLSIRTTAVGFFAYDLLSEGIRVCADALASQRGCSQAEAALGLLDALEDAARARYSDQVAQQLIAECG